MNGTDNDDPGDGFAAAIDDVGALAADTALESHDVETGGSAPVVRHGIDVVSIGRIADLLAEFGASFRGRAFTDAECAYCEGRGEPAQHYAARWAAKEAFCKVLAEESPAIPLDSIAVVREATGPRLALESPADEVLAASLEREGVDPDAVAIDVSLSHDRSVGSAVGSVTVVGIATGSRCDRLTDENTER